MKRLWAFHAASFLSAFLLFQIQPLVGKALLPDYGGSYMVWGTCLVFFQGMLVAGYGWASEAQRRLGVLRYSRAHFLLLCSALLFIPLRLDRFSAGGGDLPLFAEVTLALMLGVGLPVLALATASLILQRWLSVSSIPGHDNPYVLYAASNLGSMTALLSYPLIIEPSLDLATQGWSWWGGYGALILLHLACLPRRATAAAAAEDREARPSEAPRAVQKITWILLSAAGTAILLSVTSMITLNLASVPLLWVLPLSVYLLTFVLVFKRRPLGLALAAGAFHWVVILAQLLYLLLLLRWNPPIGVTLAIQLAVLFMVCLRCHGQLVETRPSAAAHLTVFYFYMSLGGFLGGVAVSWVVPLLSSGLIEYPLSMLLAALAVYLATRAGAAGDATDAHRGLRHHLRIHRGALVAGGVLLVSMTALPWLLLRFTTVDPRALIAVVGLSCHAAPGVDQQPLVWSLAPRSGRYQVSTRGREPAETGSAAL